MKAILGSAIAMLLLAGNVEAIHHKRHYKFAPFHGKYAAYHDALIALQDDDKPPPEIPGGLSDDRYTSEWRKEWP